MNYVDATRRVRTINAERREPPKQAPNVITLGCASVPGLTLEGDARTSTGGSKLACALQCFAYLVPVALALAVV